MTREEASVIIGNIPIEGDDCYTIAEYQEAKAMAIKALEQIEIWNATTKDRQIIAPKGTFRKIWEDEQQPSDDCISREALLNSIEEPMNWTDSEAEIQEQKDYENFVALVKSMPSVTHKTDVLDKIRAEIDQKQYDFMDDKDYDEGIRFGLMLAYQIIDKYKAKREGEEE